MNTSVSASATASQQTRVRGSADDDTVHDCAPLGHDARTDPERCGRLVVGGPGRLTMPCWSSLLIASAATVVVWAGFVLWLVAAGRRESARTHDILPDCVVLVTRLARDPRVPRRRKRLLLGLVGYLALPFDLVPDFIPVAANSTTRSSSRLSSAISSAWAANR